MSDEACIELAKRLIKWAFADDVSLRKSVSLPHKELLVYRNPILEPIIPTSHQTTRIWILGSFYHSKALVQRRLAIARSRITLSFDGWNSDNELDLLRITAHYLDADLQPRTALLALRNTYGSHTGEELKHHLLAVAREYKIANRIVYMMADNLTNNDKALKLLRLELEIDHKKSGLRCAGHIVNLVCKSMLCGIDVDCVDEVIRKAANDDEADLYDDRVSQFENTLKTNDKMNKLRAW